MLIHITPDTALVYHTIRSMTYDKDNDITLFYLTDKKWLSAKGNWIKKIQSALKVRAVAVYSDYYELRA